MALEKKERNLEIVNKYINGSSTIELSKEYNICPGTIAKILTRYDVKLRSNKVN